jgi:peptide-methionine (R)-S-oxide reductase
VLTPDQFHILRESGTERPGSSPLNDERGAGVFHCAGCDLPVYSSATKFDSGTGWPSFTAALANAVGTSIDRSLFVVRTEVHCRRCGGHLGHVFDDGPPPTGKRHCLNGAALRFRPNGA